MTSKRKLSAIEWCIGLTQVYRTTNGRNDPGYAAKARKEFRALMALARAIHAEHPRRAFILTARIWKAEKAVARLGLLGKGRKS